MMLQFLKSPSAEVVLITWIAFQLVSAAVQSLPNPSEYGGIWYKSFYNFCSVVIADFKSFVQKPGSGTNQTGGTV
jgi:hypothetical protein